MLLIRMSCVVFSTYFYILQLLQPKTRIILGLGLGPDDVDQHPFSVQPIHPSSSLLFSSSKKTKVRVRKWLSEVVNLIDLNSFLGLLARTGTVMWMCERERRPLCPMTKLKGTMTDFYWWLWWWASGFMFISDSFVHFRNVESKLGAKGE